jgi:hypothetical protein
MSSRDETPTAGEMLEELLDLVTGLGIMTMPLLVLAIPCLILLLPLAVLALPLALLAVPLVAMRAVWRVTHRPA